MDRTHAARKAVQDKAGEVQLLLRKARQLVDELQEGPLTAYQNYQDRDWPRESLSYLMRADSTLQDVDVMVDDALQHLEMMYVTETVEVADG